MKRRLCIAGLLCLGATLSQAVEEAITVPAFGPRFKEIHERVEALYRYRSGNYPAPDPQVNLFRPGAAEPTPLPDAPKTAVKTAPLDSDDTILQQAVASLKSGLIKGPDGSLYFTVDRKRYKESESFTVRVKDRLVSILVKHVTSANATLSLNDAELVVPFSTSRP